MKLNNKGFAVSTFMYMILILAIILILATLAILSSRRMIIEKQKNTAIDNVSYSQNPICEAVNGVKSLELGTEYSCEVKNGTFFNFYVLSTEGTKVNLIMDRNICEDGTLATSENKCLIAWYDDGDSNTTTNDNAYGPVTAIEGIYNATKNWTNVPNMNLNYEDEGHIADSSYGYGKIETTGVGIKITDKLGREVTRSDNQTPVIPYETNKPLKARLPRLEEVYNIDINDTTHCHGDDGTCPAWLTNGLDQSTYYSNNEHISGIYGYWILSSNPGRYNEARYVNYNGYMSYYYTSDASYSGIRPVITLPKSMLK